MISTERLRLRAFTAEDLALTFALHQNPDLQRFIPSATTPDAATAKSYLDRFMRGDGPTHRFHLVELHDGTAVALIMVKPIPPSGGGPPEEIEIGWRQVEEHCGNGYVTEAASTVLEALLRDHTDHVVAVMHPENWASRRVAERIGMRRVGATDTYYDTTTVCYRADADAR